MKRHLRDKEKVSRALLRPSRGWEFRQRVANDGRERERESVSQNAPPSPECPLLLTTFSVHDGRIVRRRLSRVSTLHVQLRSCQEVCIFLPVILSCRASAHRHTCTHHFQSREPVSLPPSPCHTRQRVSCFSRLQFIISLARMKRGE